MFENHVNLFQSTGRSKSVWQQISDQKYTRPVHTVQALNWELVTVLGSRGAKVDGPQSP